VIAGIISVISLVLILFFTRKLFKVMRTNILFHLEGNQQVFKNYFAVSRTRSVLKLDLIANIQFFSCFYFLIYFASGQYDRENEYDKLIFLKKIAIAVTFVLILMTLSTLFANNSTILSSSRWNYTFFFISRILSSLGKLALIFSLW